jgi:glycerophosphoryl diester phosphodiesterase
LTLIYGHRGARGERAENTVEGFRHAKSVGVDGIETDIALTADLVPVLHHDPELADGRLIRDLDFAALSGIPGLAEALRAVDTDWLLEIKTFPPSPEKSFSPGLLAEKVLEAIVGAKVPADRLCILAFDWAVLRAVAVLAPDIRRVCLTEPETETARELWWGPGFAAATTPQAVAQTGAFAWAAFHETLSAPQITEARTLDLNVFAWTVNDQPEFDRLAGLVDGIITDFPSRFIPPPRQTPRNSPAARSGR